MISINFEPEVYFGNNELCWLDIDYLTLICNYLIVSLYFSIGRGPPRIRVTAPSDRGLRFVSPQSLIIVTKFRDKSN